jgi:hypothetical protein
MFKAPVEVVRERHPNMSDAFVELIERDVIAFTAQFLRTLSAVKPADRKSCIETLYSLEKSMLKLEDAERAEKLKREESMRAFASDKKAKKHKR